jgi:lipid II isoglutaminyl synthase (glutamine-hydrolysing)
MTEPVGRHESHDPGETLIIPRVSSQDESAPEPAPALGRHASQPSGQPASDPAALPADAGPVVVGLDSPSPPPGETGPGPDETGPDPAETGPHPRETGPHPREAAPAPGSPGAGPGSRQARKPPAPDSQPRTPVPGAAASRAPRDGGRQITLVWVYPDLLSTYGDRGNLLVLTRRAQLRGIEVAAVEVKSDEPVPEDGDIYLLGGGEDLPQVLAARRLRADGGLARAAERGAAVFAVCAGYQLLGHEFGGVDGERLPGLGILDVTSGRGDRRGVGEIVADVDPALGVPRLTGFENHQGVTRIGAAARPLARVTLGVGNGDGTEGAYAGQVLGTYLHGPALARNPGLADLLLSWAAGPLEPLEPAAEEWARELRVERLAATAAS